MIVHYCDLGESNYAHSHMLLWGTSSLPETAKKSSMEVMSSTASVRTRTCFSHCSLKRSMFSWASLLCGFAAKANAALITCKDIEVPCLLFQRHENKVCGPLWSVQRLRLCLTRISPGPAIPQAPPQHSQRWRREVLDNRLYMTETHR